MLNLKKYFVIGIILCILTTTVLNLKTNIKRTIKDLTRYEVPRNFFHYIGDITNSKFFSQLEIPFTLSDYDIVPLNKYDFNSNIIFHAGGGYKGETYTNSRESIIHTISKGGLYIEVDIQITSDNIPVLIHDWSTIYLQRFLNPIKNDLGETQQPSLLEFKSLKSIDKTTQLTLDDLLGILKEYPDVQIITDTKENIFPLEYIKNNFPGLMNNFIPQIYNREMFFSVQALGFDKIIYTLYRDKSDPTTKEIVLFSEATNITAVTYPHDTISNIYEDLAEKLNKIGVSSFIHTINDPLILNEFIQNGGSGIYTDWIGLN